MKRLILLVAGFFFASCNSLFYQPDKNIYLTPHLLGKNFESYRIQSSSGNQLSVWRFKSLLPQTRGTVLQFHGNAENMSTHYFFLFWLTQHGFDLVTFDYSGYGTSTGEASRPATIADGTEVLKWLSKVPWMQGPIFPVGQSLGGAVLVPSLVQSELGSDVIGGLIFDSTFASYRGMAQDVLSRHVLTWPLWPLSFLVSDTNRPLDDASKITFPCLFFHSIEDPVVPLSQGEQLYEAMSCREKEFVKIDGKQHTQAFAPGPLFQEEKVLEFLCRYAGCSPDP